MDEVVALQNSTQSISIFGLSPCETTGDACVRDVTIYATGYVVVGDAIETALSPAAARYVVDWLQSDRQSPLNGSFIFIVIDSRNSVVHMVTDPIGTIPLYYSDTDARRFLCGIRPIDLVEKRGEVNISPTASTQIFAFGYNLSQASLVEGIQEVPPGAVVSAQFVEAADQKITYIQRRYWRYSQREVVTSERDYCANLADAWERISFRYRDYIAKHWTGDVLVKLTAGGDSRMLLATFLGVPGIAAATYGNCASWDRFVARAICRANSVPHYCGAVSGRECMDPALRNQMTRVIGLRTSAFIATGSAIVLGAVPQRHYLHIPGHTGDVLSGSHLHPRDITLNGKDELFNTILRRHARKILQGMINSANELGRVFRNPRMLTEPIEQYLATIPAGEPPWVSLQRWDFTFRQHRFILSDAAVLRENGPVLLPYWDLDWVRQFEQCSFEFLCRRQYYNRFVLGQCTRLEHGRRRPWPINKKSVRTLTAEAMRGAGPDAVCVVAAEVRRRIDSWRGRPRVADARYVDRVAPGPALELLERHPGLTDLLGQVLTPAGRSLYIERGLPSFLDTCELFREWFRIGNLLHPSC